MMRRVYFLFCCCCCAFVCGAQQLTLLKEYPIKARMLQVDELGNAYIVRADNGLVKLNSNGDSLANYVSVANGEMTYLDVTNPLRVLALYRSFAKLVVLDRMLAPKNELNLRKVNLVNCNVVASSAEGFLWVYDQFNASLNKLDMDLNPVIQGYDLRPQLQERPAPVSLVERERKVYMADSVLGVLVFDQFGSYLNTLEIKATGKVVVLGEQLFYLKGHVLEAYDMKSFSAKSLQLPQEAMVLDFGLTADKLFLLYPDRVSIFRLQ
ncbi:hypothetical protein [Rurimicrobium arvi]